MIKFIRQNFVYATSLEKLMSRLFYFFSFFLFFGREMGSSQSVSQAEKSDASVAGFPRRA